MTRLTQKTSWRRRMACGASPETKARALKDSPSQRRKLARYNVRKGKTSAARPASTRQRLSHDALPCLFSGKGVVISNSHLEFPTSFKDVPSSEAVSANSLLLALPEPIHKRKTPDPCGRTTWGGDPSIPLRTDPLKRGGSKEAGVSGCPLADVDVNGPKR